MKPRGSCREMLNHECVLGERKVGQGGGEQRMGVLKS